MKTTRDAIQHVRIRLFELPSSGTVTLPVHVVADALDDLLDYHKEQESLDRGFAALLATVGDDEKTVPMPTAPKPRRHLQVVRETSARAVEYDGEPPKGAA